MVKGVGVASMQQDVSLISQLYPYYRSRAYGLQLDSFYQRSGKNSYTAIPYEMIQHFVYWDTIFIVLFSNVFLLSFSSNNSGLSEESFLQRKNKSQSVTESESSLKTLSLPSLNSGTK